MLLTLRCEESTHLMSDSCHRDLTAVERWAVWLHQLVCSYCRKVAAQLKVVDEAARRRAAEASAMPADARQRIAASLAEADAPVDHGANGGGDR
ncbi:MAG: hypothetical protein AAF790_10540 [Planctomycetota bacterium]